MKRRRRKSTPTVAAEVLEDRALLSAGALDPTFDVDGIVEGQPGAGQDTVWDIELQPDGKILAAGGNTGGFIGRFLDDGSTDASFGTGGYVAVPGLDLITDVEVLPDGKIVAVGSEDIQGTTADAQIYRFEADGSVDPTFSVVTQNTAGPYPEIEVDSAGRIVFYNSQSASSTTSVLARYNADGTPDTSFGVSGETTTTNTLFPLHDIEIDSSDRILLATDSLRRFTATGVLDTSFTSNSTSQLFAVGIAADGAVYASGINDTSSAGIIESFDATGSVVNSASSSTNFMFDIAFQTDGRVLIGGGTISASTPAEVLRFEADLTPDTGFGAPTVSTDSAVLGIRVDSADRIVVGGVAGGVNGIMLARLTPGDLLPQANDDASEITEDASPNTTSENVLANDVDDGVLTVAAVNGVPANVGVPMTLTYGSIVIDANGDCVFTLDNGNAAVQALDTGDTLTETVTYMVEDLNGQTATANLTITIHGEDESTSSTPLDQVDDLVDEVFEIYNNGGISANSGNWLLRTLSRVRRAIFRGRTSHAVRQLRIFQTQVAILYYTNRLSFADASNLFGMASDLITDL